MVRLCAKRTSSLNTRMSQLPMYTSRDYLQGGAEAVNSPRYPVGQDLRDVTGKVFNWP